MKQKNSQNELSVSANPIKKKQKTYTRNVKFSSPTRPLFWVFSEMNNKKYSYEF